MIFEILKKNYKKPSCFFGSGVKFDAAGASCQIFQNKAPGEEISMAEKPWKCQKAHTKSFTLTKWPEFCKTIEEDIFSCQKDFYSSHQ